MTYQDITNQSKAFLVENEFNKFKIHEWDTLLQSNTLDLGAYEDLLLYFSVNAFQTKTGFSSVDPPRFLDCLEGEIYNVLSDDKNRGKANILMSAAISGISAMVATKFGLNAFIVSGFSNLIIVSVIKVGIDSWCSFYKKKNPDKQE